MSHMHIIRAESVNQDLGLFYYTLLQAGDRLSDNLSIFFLIGGKERCLMTDLFFFLTTFFGLPANDWSSDFTLHACWYHRFITLLAAGALPFPNTSSPTQLHVCRAPAPSPATQTLAVWVCVYVCVCMCTCLCRCVQSLGKQSWMPHLSILPPHLSLLTLHATASLFTSWDL